MEEETNYFMKVQKEAGHDVSEYFQGCEEEDLKPDSVFAFQIVDVETDKDGNIDIGFRLVKLGSAVDKKKKSNIFVPRLFRGRGNGHA